MKKIFLALFVCFALVGCKVFENPIVAIGTSEQDFINQYKKKIYSVEQSSERSVYGYYAAGPDNFYYFSGGKLYKVDRGVKEADVKVEVNHK